MAEPQISILFFGTPHAAVPSLCALLDNPAFSVAAAVTQPDRPAGRGQKLTSSPLCLAAAERGLTVLKPESLKGIAGGPGALTGTAANQDFVEFLNSRPRFDLFVVVAFGQIIPRPMLELPRAGIINVHFSLLPRWRGAAPIQRAIASGDKTTGVAIMKIEAGLDTGPIYEIKEIPIGADDNFGTIHDKLSEIGAVLLAQTLPQIAAGALIPRPQDSNGATIAAKWERADMQIDWNDPAAVTFNKIRASSPFWGARATFCGEPVKIFAATLSPVAPNRTDPPGTVVAVNRSEIIVRAGDGQGVAITELQLSGKRKMPVKEYLAGNPVAVGAKFD